MRIDPKIEQPTREMLGHAMRHELQELAALVHAEGDQVLVGAIGLCITASAYLVIDVCEQWPTEADLREIAKSATTAATGLDLNEGDIVDYLSRSVFGSEPLDEVFEREAAGFLPLFITANLLATFRPEELHWWEYLDQIWRANDAAAQVGKEVLPALMFQVRKSTPAQ